MKTTEFVALGIGALLVGSLAGCGAKDVSYRAKVQPVLEKYCIECHKPGGEGFEKSGQDMSSYAALMRGTKFGATVKANDSFTSALVMLIEGRADSSIKMPHNREPIPADDIKTIKMWIDQGAKDN